MTRSLSALALSAVYIIGLTACATAPKAETLMTGISPTALSKPLAEGEMRDAADPVCVSFYKNARTYAAEANKPNPGGQFLKTLGISVLAGNGAKKSGVQSKISDAAEEISCPISFT